MHIQEQIKKYVEYRENLDYIDSILKSAEPGRIFDMIAETLDSQQRAQICTANLFIRDVMLLTAQVLPESVRTFREGFYASTLVDALNRNVFAAQSEVRVDSVYTIGRVGLHNSVGVLLDAFNRYFENDPLFMRRLLFELVRLGDTHKWNLVEQMAQSAHYLTRWAILSTHLFDSFGRTRNETDAGLQLRYLELLRQDSEIFVRNEAAYKLEDFKLSPNVDHLSDLERKNARRQRDLHAPKITFDDLAIRFLNYLFSNQIDDYTVSELETFVHQTIH